MNWRSGSNGNWDDAVQRYNGGGDPNYLKKFNQTMNNFISTSLQNY
jgi:hypothetical protein